MRGFLGLIEIFLNAEWRRPEERPSDPSNERFPMAALPTQAGAVASTRPMRHESTADDIQRFMQRISVEVREEGCVYFTGGVSAVLAW